VYPAHLREAGLAAALRSLSRHAGLPVTVSGSWEQRHGEDVELAAYFCCLEALQNAASTPGRARASRSA
jgi:hypothetical protein